MGSKNWKKNYDIIVDLSVTSPLRIVKDIKSAIELLINEKADNVFSVSPAYRNPYYNMVEDVNGKIRKVKELNEKITKRQDASMVYDMNDSINVWWKKLFLSRIKLQTHVWRCSGSPKGSSSFFACS